MRPRSWILSVVALVVLTGLAQLLLLVRAIILTGAYGGSEPLDAFNLSVNYTSIITNIYGVAVATVLIPHLVERRFSGQARPYISWALLASLATGALIIGLVTLLPNLFTGGFTTAGQALFQLLVAAFMAAQFFRVTTYIAAAIAQSHNLFTVPKLIALLPAVLPLIFLLTVSTDLRLLALVLVICYIAEAAVSMLYVAKLGDAQLFRPTLRANAQARKLASESWPIIVSSSIFQLQLLVVSTAMGYFGPGTITFFTNANQLVGAAQAIVVSNLIVVAYPTVSRWVQTDLAEALRRLPLVAGLLNWIAVALVGLYIAGGQDLIAILFVRGQFSLEQAQLVWLFGLFLVLAFPIGVLRDLIYRVHYALGQARIPSRNSIMVVVVNILLIAITAPRGGAMAVLGSVFAGSIISLTAILMTTLRGGVAIPVLRLLGPTSGCLIAAGACSVAVHFLRPLATEHWASLVLLSGAFLLGYLALTGAWAFRRIAELRALRPPKDD